MVETTGQFLQKCMRIGYCMDYDLFCAVMHSGIQDEYSKAKWEMMQSNFSKWFMTLDTGHSSKYVGYCRNLNG